MSKGKNKRKRVIRELVRQVEMERAARIKPVTKEEKKEFYSLQNFLSLIQEIKDAMYHKPSNTIIQRSFDNLPEKSLSQLLKEYIRNKIQTSV